tara:strand:+ start:26956 stop:27555 length:600 start_codon:yes stop_codon:yes gene_type:complete
MQIILSDINESLVEAWTHVMSDLDQVTISNGSILDLSADAIVSPANSFGFMDGGVDAIYCAYFASDIQMTVRRAIWEQHGGELVVGAAVVVPTNDSNLPFLIAAPTMRVPMRLPADSVAPYLATRSAIRAAIAHPKIRTVSLPGMGTGVGRVTHENCARQMRQGILDATSGDYRMPGSWAEASERHQLLYGATPRNLQF